VKNPPITDSVPVIRADFSNDALWLQLQEEIARPTVEGFEASVDFVEDRTLSGLSEAAISKAFAGPYPDDYEHPVLFVVDATTIALPEHPLLVIDLDDEDPSKPFRCLPSAVQSIENNLSIANMDFFEFADSADSDGVFRGF
jgi:hypothetical protein